MGVCLICGTVALETHSAIDFWWVYVNTTRFPITRFFLKKVWPIKAKPLTTGELLL